MSESAAPDSSLIPPPPRPEAFIGMASPLWAYFAGAAVSGAALWWMMRWTRAENLEALFGLPGTAARAGLDALPPAAPIGVAMEATAESAETVQDTARLAETAADEGAGLITQAANDLAGAGAQAAAEAILEEVLPPEPVGGESAPVSPALEAAAVAPPRERSRKVSPPESDAS